MLEKHLLKSKEQLSGIITHATENATLDVLKVLATPL